MLKVYLDLDGVIADFHSSFPGKFDSTAFKRAVVEDKIFTNLKILPDAYQMLLTIAKYDNFDIEILSSLGAPNDMELAKEVAEQKEQWVTKVLYREFPFLSNIKCNFVTHKGLKKHFATPKSLLIDDTQQNIWDFNEYRGWALHWDVNDKNRFDKLNNIVDKFYEHHVEKSFIYAENVQNSLL